MGMWVFRNLLGDLARAFLEDAQWDDGEGGGGTIVGRFRIDPHEVALGGIEPGLGTIQTWFYCDRKVVPGARIPVLGDYLVIRNQTWEVAEGPDEDDLGELAYRLIKRTIGAPPFEPVEPDEPDEPDETRRAAGRPSRRDEVVAAFEAAKAAGDIDDRPRPMGEIIRIVRRRIPDCRAGVGDKTLRRILTPLVAARGGKPTGRTVARLPE